MLGFVNPIALRGKTPMKKLFLVCVALAGLATARARAADIPAYPLPPPPPPVVGIPDCWTGFYFGPNLGYHQGQDIISSSANPIGWGPLEATAIDGHSATWLQPRGTVLGGQAGFNWQLRNVVFGWEADGEWLGGAANRLYTFQNVAFVPNGDAMYNSSAANVVATLRPRLGVAFGNLLVYGTAGLAMGWFSNTDSFASFGGTALATTPSTTVRPGWTGGGGIEWKFLPAWSVKAEYLYLHMQNYNVIIPASPSTSPPLPNSDITIHRNYTDNFVRVGVNWHMSP
jgi:outer membrane immunogenic protein